MSVEDRGEMETVLAVEELYYEAKREGQIDRSYCGMLDNIQITPGLVGYITGEFLKAKRLANVAEKMKKHRPIRVVLVVFAIIISCGIGILAGRALWYNDRYLQGYDAGWVAAEDATKKAAEEKAKQKDPNGFDLDEYILAKREWQRLRDAGETDMTMEEFWKAKKEG